MATKLNLTPHECDVHQARDNMENGYATHAESWHPKPNNSMHVLRKGIIKTEFNDKAFTRMCPDAFHWLFAELNAINNILQKASSEKE